MFLTLINELQIICIVFRPFVLHYMFSNGMIKTKMIILKCDLSFFFTFSSDHYISDQDICLCKRVNVFL